MELNNPELNEKCKWIQNILIILDNNQKAVETAIGARDVQLHPAKPKEASHAHWRPDWRSIAAKQQVVRIKHALRTA